MVKTGLPTEFPGEFQDKQTAEHAVTSIFLVVGIRFLSMKKFHAKQNMVLSSSVKLGPCL